MRSPVRKIGLLILAIIVLPVLIFSIFEIGRLRENEKVIQDIYRNQLDAILFSINQYSDDFLGSLANKIENSYENDSRDAVTRLISETPSVKCLAQFDEKYAMLSCIPDSYCNSQSITGITAGLKKSENRIKRLQNFLIEGYRKIDTIDYAGTQNEQWIVFLSRDTEKDIINVLIIDPEKFIGQILDPKIQEIARDKFHIAAYHVNEPDPVYTSGKQYNTTAVVEKRPFWLLTDYQMGIELKDATIADLAKDRLQKNLLLVAIIDLILISGAWLIFMNVKKQIELSQLKSDFISNVSHEIRTPLALISMYVETLDMGRVKNPGKVKEYYDVILNETSRLSAMVNRILGFSQIENNKRRYSFGECDLNEIACKASATFRYTLESRGFQFAIEPLEHLPLINADRDAVTDAVVNLLDNAMKYSSERKEISVRIGKDTKFAYIEVEDHGIGISDKNQRYIFDKFFRVTEKNLAARVKGSGLGLAIVRHIMDAHNGKISVYSVPGTGSRFRLLFPVK